MKFIGILFIILAALIAAFSIFNLFTWRYKNPYKLIMVFGKKGSGKSTLLARFAQEHYKKGWTVYSTEKTPNCYFVDPVRIGQVQFDDFNYKEYDPNDYKGLSRVFHNIKNWFFPNRQHCLLLVDEVGMIWDNRNFKNFRTDVRDFFKLQRHYHVKVILFSQTFDIDKKLRDLTDTMYLCTNFFNVFSVAKKIRKYATIVETQTGESTITEGYKFEPFFIPGSRIRTFIPKYSKYFNSFEAPELEHMKFVFQPFHNK